MSIFKKKPQISILWIIFMVVMAAPCYSTDAESFTPWDFSDRSAIAKTSSKSKTEAESTGAVLWIKAVRFYQNHISAVIGDRCPMNPSCSAYSIEAIKKHGFFIGVVMTADRLIHENNEMDLAPLVKVKDEYRFYDPISYNDFWWYKPKDLHLK
ncbi:MAG: membrane protein insertion efficiency factor YidD [Deltaproteobacteria bacterium]|nr:membrane protein insertion efficiency factor YidD [Deltaproteobacteria bacterium]